ncbi:MAG: amino acid permease C-terminal domain-containing protein, partial [Gemmatimonadota bacterium]
TPLVPLVPILGILVCFGMMAGLPGDTWLRLLIWLAIGFVIYFLYSRRHSLIQHGLQVHETEPAKPTYTEPKRSTGAPPPAPRGPEPVDDRRRGRRGGRGRGGRGRGGRGSSR